MGIFDDFKEKILSSVNVAEETQQDDHKVDDLIALGVLLWEVADADDQFLPKETDKIEEILREHNEISQEDMPIVLRAIEEASVMKIDLFSFTKDVSGGIERKDKIYIVENLFRVACVDHDLDNTELETIRKISGLFGLDHQEFIECKIKVKKEYGMDTTGL